MINFDKLKTFLESQDYKNIREMSDGTVAAVQQYIFTGGICYNIDFNGIGGRYCYEHINEAIKALNEWDGIGDPSGNWIVKKPEGRQGPGSKENVKED